MSSLRSLLKAPGFTVVAVLTLTIGLGANTAIFSAVYSILLKPLPFPASEQLVSVRAMIKRETWEQRSFSVPDFRDYQSRATRSFAALAAFDGANFNLTGEGEASRVRAERVTSSFFEVFGIAPTLGRTFTAEENSAPGRGQVVVLSHDFWRTRFDASNAALGRQLKLSDVDYTIIGVMPASFAGSEASTQLWVPMSTIEAETWNARGNRFQNAVGRLNPGVTLEQARAELASIGLKLAEQYPGTNANYSADVVPLREELFGDLRGPLVALLGAVGVVLVITCVNVANLLLVRLAIRRREIAIRISVGASRGQLARLFLMESLGLAPAGGAAGTVLAAWILAALKRFAPIELPRFVALELHWPGLLFAIAAALLCALAIGALPALLAGRIDLNAALKDGARGEQGGPRGAQTRAMLMTAELALSLALLVASSLFVRSFIKLVTQAPGYRTEKVVTQRLLVPPARYTHAQLQQFTRTLLERAAALPGVRTAALATDTPLDGNSNATHVVVEGAAPVAPENEIRVYVHSVTPDFFSATGITLLQGKTFADHYAENSEPVAVVSESFARRFWPKGDAVGKRLRTGGQNSNVPWFRIIGVVAEAKYRGLVANPTRDPDGYAAFDQQPTYGFSLVLHTIGDSRSVAQSVRQLVASLDSGIPVFAAATIEERIARASASQRFSAQLMGAFAVLALGLAAIGLYGVVSFSVAQRTQEIGVRMALGARPTDIAAMVLGHTTRLVAIGIMLGLGSAVALSRLIEPLLFQTDPRDPLLYAGVGLLLGLVAALAAWLPARRAARVDPMTALRAE